MKAIVGAVGYDASMIKNKYAGGVPNRTEAVGDHEGGPSLYEIV